jgi:hypothetical protein
VVLVAGHGPLPLERIRAAAAEDRSPALLLRPSELAALCAGTAPWHDEIAAAGRS